MTLDNGRLKSLNFDAVALFVAFCVPYLAYAWYLCETVRESKRSWGYITVSGQRIYG